MFSPTHTLFLEQNRIKIDTFVYFFQEMLGVYFNNQYICRDFFELGYDIVNNIIHIKTINDYEQDRTNKQDCRTLRFE